MIGRTRRPWVWFGAGVLTGFAVAGVGVATGNIYHADDVVLGFFPPKPQPEDEPTDPR